MSPEETFFKRYPTRRFRKGQIVLLNGDMLDHVHFIVEGRIRQYDVTYRGDEIVLNRFKPGSFFPMSLAINPMPSPYMFEAETETEVHSAPVRDVLDFLESNPEVTYDLLTRVYRGMDGFLGRMVQLMGGSARSRLAYEISLEARRFGVPRRDGSILLETHEHTLGEQAGMSRETVSREVHKMKREDIIEISPAGIVVKDLKALEELIKV